MSSSLIISVLYAAMLPGAKPATTPLPEHSLNKVPNNLERKVSDSSDPMKQIIDNYGGAVYYPDGSSYSRDRGDLAKAKDNMSLYNSWKQSNLGSLVSEYLDSRGLPASHIDGYVSMDLPKFSGKSGAKAAVIYTTDRRKYLALDRNTHDCMSPRALSYVLGHEYLHDRGIMSEDAVRGVYGKALWHAAKKSASKATRNLALYLKQYADFAKRSGKEALPA